MEYQEFLKSKYSSHKNYGFDIADTDLNSILFDFQKFLIKVALKKGKYALFTDTGTGKTFMQCEWAKHVSIKTQNPVLILAPLAVAGQTINEAKKLNIDIQKFNSLKKSLNRIYIANYEQLDNIDCSMYSGVVLDESSILKNFTGKIKQNIIDKFKDTHFKLACTATPSPNDHMELGNHAEFLNVMSRNEMLSMYFVHDGGDTAKWRLKKHAHKDFWKWVSTWAAMMMKPSDIGFGDERYMLPDLNIIEHEIETPKRDNGKLFNDVVINATNYNDELRQTKEKRMDISAQIVNASNESFIIWIKQNEEGEYLKKLIPDAVEVKGADSPEYKESKLLGFANDEFRVLITKPKIAQFGLNYQNCHNQIFASPDFSYEGLYQAIRRSYRFGQKSDVNIHILVVDTMQSVTKSLERKRKDFDNMKEEMRKAGINIDEREHKVADIDSVKVKGDNFELWRGDSCELTKEIKTESIGFEIFSPPFAELYVYSDHPQDIGNSKDYKEFFEQFKYLTPELYRILKPGRLCAVHCMDLPIQKGKEGYIGLRDFSGMIIEEFQSAGFIYHDRITIWKDPVIEMQRTKALGLLHKQIKKDSSMCRTGIPDYLLVFRKDGDNQEPIKNTDMPVDLWQQYASPIWMDINYSDTLQRESARDHDDEKHIAPLQLQTIERAITLWSNKGDIVFSPFAGIGSEGYQALKMNRKYHGIELKESYFEQAQKNLVSAEQLASQLSLF